MIFMTRIGSTPAPDTSSVTLGLRAILPSAIRGSRLFYSLVAGWAKPRVPRDAPRGHFNKCLPRVPRGSTSGFSLLELLLVLFIMGLMTTTAMLMTGGVEDQSKYDETKRRMELIKRAIVGDPTRTVNGGPEISGFVADMGRLPVNLGELMEQDTLSAWDVATSDVPVSGVDTIPVDLHGGWRGPYLEVMPDDDGGRVFRDGYGYEFKPALSGVVALRLQSVGPNGVEADADDYPVAGMMVGAASYPVSAVLANASDWIAATSGVSDFTVDFGKAPSSAQALILRLYWVQDGAMQSCQNSLTASVSSVQASTGACADLPMGRLAAVVVCDDTNHYLYDGDCGGDTLHAAPFYFTLVPRAQLPLIRWNIQ